MEVQKLSQQLTMFGANLRNKAAKTEPAKTEPAKTEPVVIKGESKGAESVKETVVAVAKKAEAIAKTAEKIKNEKIAANAEQAREVKEKAEKQIAKRLAEQVNEYLSKNNWSLKYYFHAATNRMAARIVDNETNEVIREVPPKELLDLAARMEKFVGVMLDKLV